MGKQVGTFIRELREKRGLSQGDVARMLSLKTAQSISNIERGVSPLPKSKIKKIADILGVNKNEIVTIVLGEVQNRYSKAAGVQNSSNTLFALDLPSDETAMVRMLAEKLKKSKSTERLALKKQMKKILGNA